MRLFICTWVLTSTFTANVLQEFEIRFEETALGGSLGKFRVKHPNFMTMIESQPEIIIPPDSDSGLEGPVRLKILSPISAGQFGIVVKATANQKEIAFKLLLPSDDEELELQEIFIMNYLHKGGMTQVLKPELGLAIHWFDVGEQTFRGFGMELFQYPTLLQYFRTIGLKNPDCVLSAVRCFVTVFGGMTSSELQMKPGYRAMLLGTSFVKSIYQAILRAIMDMWKLGVIHNDLHISNILYDEEQERFRIIDFGMATMPLKDQQKKFLLGVVLDLMRFTFSFVVGILYSHSYGESGDIHNRDWDLIKKSVFTLQPHALDIVQGHFPATPQWMEVYWSFCDIFGIPRSDIQYPSPARVQQVVNDGNLNFESIDSPAYNGNTAGTSSEAGPSNVNDHTPDTPFATFDSRVHQTFYVKPGLNHRVERHCAIVLFCLFMVLSPWRLFITSHSSPESLLDTNEEI